MSTAGPDRRGDILIVDDTPANLRLLSETLSAHNYRVRAVTSGARALASARATPPDLVLLDIRMPDMDGFEVCRRLKADEQTADIPVIFISALADVEDKVRAFETGGVDYICKPFQVEEVLARTQTHLALRRLQSRLEETSQRMQRELQLASTVQASFLPGRLPDIPGWQLAATLRPARLMSGDFYDVIRLSGGRLGLIMADVVDKGVPAALLMAMSWSMLDTIALEHPDDPAAVFAAVNSRLLLHLEGEQFVTVFYGILDPASGRLKYCNAGHPPALMANGADEPARLLRTGPPLGILEEIRWETREVMLPEGSALVLYTDGVTDVQSADGDFYEETRLKATLKAAPLREAHALQAKVLSSLEAFAAGTAQYDDIALLVLSRAGSGADN
jgi:sigma-B regulation protein RsbU (phosphoserine phosphatase)